MKISDFDFELPQAAIAQTPTSKRSRSKLLEMDSQGRIEDSFFYEIINKVHSGDVLILNNTKVIPARLHGSKAETGGKVELLLERIVDQNTVLAQIKASNALKNNQIIKLAEGYKMQVVNKNEDLYLLKTLNFDQDVTKTLDKIGQTPLPPYITESDKKTDKNRYQTVYAKEQGAVAAPTAGLHFDEELLEQIKTKGVTIAFITLHVGAGTFKPVATDSITEHKMHDEYIEISAETARIINKAKQEGRRIIATGTTSLRAIEAVAKKNNGQLTEHKGMTNLFIYPGFKFNIIDVLITNFHLPKSTLLLLVSAFTQKEAILQAYKHALDNQYRFFSYGDAMLLHKFEGN